MGKENEHGYPARLLLAGGLGKKERRGPVVFLGCCLLACLPALRCVCCLLCFCLLCCVVLVSLRSACFAALCLHCCVLLNCWLLACSTLLRSACCFFCCLLSRVCLQVTRPRFRRVRGGTLSYGSAPQRGARVTTCPACLLLLLREKGHVGMAKTLPRWYVCSSMCDRTTSV